MNSTPSKFVVRDHLPTIVAHVFETMLGLQTAPAAATQSFGFERVSGTIGIAGENVNGTVYFHLPGRLARADALGLGSGTWLSLGHGASGVGGRGTNRAVTAHDPLVSMTGPAGKTRNAHRGTGHTARPVRGGCRVEPRCIAPIYLC